jgi:adenylate kinase
MIAFFLTMLETHKKIKLDNHRDRTRRNQNEKRVDRIKLAAGRTFARARLRRR